MTSYLVGTGVTMRAAEYRNESGVLVDPENVVLTYRRPDGDETVVEMTDLVHPSTGEFTLEVVADEPGVWTYTFTATNPTVVGDGFFVVEATATGSTGRLQPSSSPCEPWADDEQLLNYAPSLSSVDAALRSFMLRAASDVLWDRSARRYPGVCIDTIRPQGSCSGYMQRWSYMMPTGSFGVFLDQPHSHLGFGCCDGGIELTLGPSPVTQVFEVRVDGAVLDASKWRVMDWGTLRRIDGHLWPCCNHIIGDVARVEVDLAFGEPPPDSGVLACIALARELVKGAQSDATCQLNRRVQQITREGVQMSLPGLVDTLRDGRTGIPEVDLFLWAKNPNGLQRRGRIIIPGRGGTRRRTFP